MQTTGKVTRANLNPSGDAVVSIDPDDSSTVRNMSNISVTNVGNTDDLHVGDTVTISITKG